MEWDYTEASHTEKLIKNDLIVIPFKILEKGKYYTIYFLSDA